MPVRAAEQGGLKAGLMAVAGIVLFSLLLHSDQVFGGRVFYTEDVLSVFGPSRFLVGESLAGGEIPFWNPWIFAGAPFFENPENAIFYPLTILFVLLPLVTALKVSLVLHTVLTAGFACLCFRRVFRVGTLPAFLGGITFAFSSYYAYHVVHHRDVVSVPWIPVAFLLLDRALSTPGRRALIPAAGASLVLGMQLFGGATQTSVLTFTLLAAWAGWRLVGEILRREPAAALRTFSLTALALGLGAGVASAQILPSMTLVGESFRAGGVSWNFASYLSIPPPQAAATLFFPHLFGRWGVDWWGLWTMHETILYVGILPLLLVVAAFLGRRETRGVWFLLVLALVSLLLAFGHWTPLYRFLYETVPGYDMFRVPARFTLLLCFAVAALCSVGAHALFSGKLEPGRTSRILKRMLFPLGGLVVALFAAAAAAPQVCAKGVLALVKLVKGADYLVKVNPDLVGSTRRAFDRLAMSIGEDFTWHAGAAVVIALSVFVLLRALRRRGDGRAALAAVLLADLAFFSLAAPHRHTVPDVEVNRETPLVAFLRENLEVDERIDERKSEQLKWNRAMPHRIRAVDGRNLGIYPAVRYGQFLKNLDSDHPRLFDMLRVRYIVTGPYSSPPRGYPLVFESGGERVVENPDVLPPGWFPETVTGLPGDAAVRERVASFSFDPRREAYIVEGDRSEAGRGTAELLSFRAHEVRYRVKAEKEGLFVTSERWYPGWEASVDGGEGRPCIAVNGILRGVDVPEGEHEVVFEFNEPSLSRGILLSAVALCLALAAILIGYLGGRPAGAKESHE